MTTFDVTQVDSERTSIREMTEAELDAVHGGVAPIIAAVAGIAMNTTVRSLGAALVSRGLAIYGVYSAASHYGGGGGRFSRSMRYNR